MVPEKPSEPEETKHLLGKIRRQRALKEEEKPSRSRDLRRTLGKRVDRVHKHRKKRPSKEEQSK